MFLQRVRQQVERAPALVAVNADVAFEGQELTFPPYLSVFFYYGSTKTMNENNSFYMLCVKYEQWLVRSA